MRNQGITVGRRHEWVATKHGMVRKPIKRDSFKKASEKPTGKRPSWVQRFLYWLTSRFGNKQYCCTYPDGVRTWPMNHMEAVYYQEKHPTTKIRIYE